MNGQSVCWLASGPGIAGIAVVAVRTSPEAHLPRMLAPIAYPVHCRQPDRPLLHQTPRPDGCMVYCRIEHDGETIDDALVALWPSRGLAEIHLHGGPRIVQRVLQALAENGIGFLPDPPAHYALALFSSLSPLQTALLHLATHAPSPDAEYWLLAQAWGPNGLHTALAQLAKTPDHALRDQRKHLLARWSENARRAAPLLEPSAIVLLGPPNAGKSSLFNALLGQPRSIVSSLPGTTRDWIDARALVAGLPVRLYDTAGQRPTDDPLEQAGIEAINAIPPHATTLALILASGQEPYPHDLLESLLCALPPHWLTLRVRTHADGPQAGWTWPAAGPRDRGHSTINTADARHITHLARAIRAALLPAPPPASEPALPPAIAPLVHTALNAPSPSAALRQLTSNTAAERQPSRPDPV